MRQILLVGSMNLADAEDVFRTVAGVLGEAAFAVPDGETGYARLAYKQCQLPFFLAHNQLDIVEPDPDHEGQYRTPRVPACGIYAHDPKDLYRGMARLRDGVDPADLAFDELGYAGWAIESYAVFARLKAEGVVAPGTRFLVDMPTPRCVVRLMLPSDVEKILPAYTRGLGNEAAKMARAIPHDQLAIQWSTTEPGRYDDMSPEERSRTKHDMAELARFVPEDIPLGYHLCYGDLGHRHVVEPPTLSTPVDIANALMRHARRRIDWVHMPVPQDRTDEPYFVPLQDLTLRPGTRLNLGLVHEADGLDGARERMRVADKFTSEYGISTECGLGRRQPEVIPDLLRLHLEIARI